MASATGIPQNPPARVEGSSEEEPLLGRTGDASQLDGQPLYFNLIIGTAVLTQAGIFLLFALVYASVFLHPLMLFSAHPLLNVTALLLLTQSLLLLQPTHTPAQKRAGTLAHASLNIVSLLLLVASLVVIEYNKISHAGAHFESPHAILGLVTYVLLLLQTAVGLAQYFAPGLLGGVAVAKSVYKYHRASGYLVLVLALATVAAATQTTFNVATLHIRLWAVLLSAVLILVGIVPRIKLQKFGFKAAENRS